MIVKGDFNSDGYQGFAAIFMPASDIKETSCFKINKFWHYSGGVSSGKSHKSLVVFHGGKTGWLSDSIQA